MIQDAISSANLIEFLCILYIRVTEALGTISMEFQILITPNFLFEKILQHGYSGYVIMLVFRILDLILQGGKSYSNLKLSFVFN